MLGRKDMTLFKHVVAAQCGVCIPPPPPSRIPSLYLKLFETKRRETVPTLAIKPRPGLKELSFDREKKREIKLSVVPLGSTHKSNK